jgi:hypothetical protein
MVNEYLFEEIASEAIAAAERIKCDFADFVEGLRTIESLIRERRVNVEDELRSQEDG